MKSVLRLQGSAGLFLAVSMISAIFVLLAGPAAAQAVTSSTGYDPGSVFDMFKSSTGDAFSSVYLNQLFGPLFPSATGSNTVSLFSSLIGYFNSIVLVVGGMLFFYNVTVGVLQSAHEGEVLGKRWSSLWAPLRIIFTVGLMVPVPNLGGYNLAQSGVGFLVRGGGSLASWFWQTGATMIISDKIAVTTAPATVDPNTATALFRNASCAVILNKQFADAAAANGASAAPVVAWGKSTSTASTNYGEVTYSSYVRGADGSPIGSFNNICGSYSTPEMPSYIKKIKDDPDSVGLPGSASAKQQIKQEFDDLHLKVITGLVNDFQDIAANNYASIANLNTQELPDFTQKIADAMTKANQTLDQGIQSLVQNAAGASLEGQSGRDAMLARIGGNCVSKNSGSDDAKTSDTCYGEGWMGAGSWYMMIARLNNEISSLTDARDTATTGSYLKTIGPSQQDLYLASGGKSTFFERVGGVSEEKMAKAGVLPQTEAQQLSARYDKAFDNSKQNLAAFGFPMSNADLSSVSVNTAGGFLKYIPGVATMVTSVTNMWLDFTSPTNFASDPMIGMTMIGNYLIGIGAVLTGAIALAGLSGLGFSVIPNGIATALQLPASAVLGAGATLSVILPMTPYIFWVLAISGYFLLIVEAIVAVNLWALAHMRMDGEGISGDAGRQGWIMLLSLTLTPTLMIVGYLFGMQLFRVTTALFNIGLHQAVAGVVGSSLFTAFSAFIIYSVLSAVIYMLLIERSFSLVADFPGRVMRWMGDHVQVGADLSSAKMVAGAGAFAAAKSPMAAARSMRMGMNAAYGMTSKGKAAASKEKETNRRNEIGKGG